MEADVVGTELGADGVGEVAERHAPLALLAGVPIAQLGNPQRKEGGDEGDGSRGVPQRLADPEEEVELRVAGRFQRGDRRRHRESQRRWICLREHLLRTLSGLSRILIEEEALGAAAHQVVEGEVAAGGIELDAIPVRLVIGLDTEVLEDLGRHAQHRRRKQGLSDQGARSPQSVQVDGVGHVDALVEEALPPVQQLVTGADLQRAPGDLVISVEVGVQQLVAHADDSAPERAAGVERLAGEVGAGGVGRHGGEVVEDAASEEAPVVPPGQLDVDGRLVGVREDVPGVVVEIAVVEVGEAQRGLAAAVVHPDQLAFAVLDAHREARRDRGVHVALELPGLEVDGRCGPCPARPQDDQGGDHGNAGRGSRPVRAPFVERAPSHHVPPVIPSSSLLFPRGSELTRASGPLPSDHHASTNSD